MKEKNKIWFNRNWFKIALLIVLVIVIGGAFYWYELRPSIIKKSCYNVAVEAAIKKANNVDKKFSKDDYDVYYKWCLQKKGL
jgi:uncharacterized protein YxeA